MLAYRSSGRGTRREPVGRRSSRRPGGGSAGTKAGGRAVGELFVIVD
jgi:hypothetical protein